MEWREIKPGEWWYLFEDAPDDPRLPDANNVYHPPSMVMNWVGYPTACCHLYNYYNGAMPDDEPDDNNYDYIHICDPNEFIKDIQKWIETSKYIGEED